eukprot:573662-Rhodomonas_salina.1
MTLSTKVAAFTVYSRVRTRLLVPSALAWSSMRRSVPSTPDLTPKSTWMMMWFESEYSELAVTPPHLCPGLIQSPMLLRLVPVTPSLVMI